MLREIPKHSKHDDRVILDADMTPADIVGVLERLKFREDQFHRIEIDNAVRDYLVAALSARRK